jgi:hypothetical protein
MAMTYAAPASAAAGRVKWNCVELSIVSGISEVPDPFRPPRFWTPDAVSANRLMTVSDQNPVPVTVTTSPVSEMLLIVTSAPIGTERMFEVR